MNLTGVEGLFWLSLVLVGYAYAGYPLALWLATRFSRRQEAELVEPTEPPGVTIVVAAHNERTFIGDKVVNALGVDYPPERLQLIVASDGSSDGTAACARQTAGERATILEIMPRGGKANALNQALPRIAGEIVVFSDANVFFERSAIRELVRPFSDPRVGCVSGNVALAALEDGEPLGESAYMQYERFLYRLESQLGCMMGVDGAMFACRARLLRPLPQGVILDDYLTGMRVVAAGYRIRYQPTARAIELVPASVRMEFRRKVRIAAGAFQVLPHLSFLATPWRFPVATLFFVSHKFLRWIAPVLLIGLLGSTVALSGGAFYRIALGVQGAIISLAVLGAASARLRRIGIFYVPYYFSAMNLALLLGMCRQMAGRGSGIWQRVDR